MVKSRLYFTWDHSPHFQLNCFRDDRSQHEAAGTVILRRMPVFIHTPFWACLLAKHESLRWFGLVRAEDNTSPPLAAGARSLASSKYQRERVCTSSCCTPSSWDSRNNSTKIHANTQDLFFLRHTPRVTCVSSCAASMRQKASKVLTTRRWGFISLALPNSMQQRNSRGTPVQETRNKPPPSFNTCFAAIAAQRIIFGMGIFLKRSSKGGQNSWKTSERHSGITG